MALPIQPTLGEARDEVLRRLGFTSQGSAVIRNRELVESFIRKTMRTIAHEVEWTEQYLELHIDLIEGQDRYDFPDEADVGTLDSMWIQDESGRSLRLEGGTSPQDYLGVPEDSEFSVEVGTPQRFDLLNREIRLHPAPRDTWVRLNIRYVQRLPPLIEQGEFLPFEGELILQGAEILGRIHYKMPGAPEMKAEFERYMLRVKRQQGPGRTFSLMGGTSYLVMRPNAPRRVHQSDVGRESPWSEGWRPW